MHEIFLHETFDTPTIDPRLGWYNPPQKWSIHNSCLVIEPDAKTDYWQKTHYGFTADNGHFLYLEVEGDFVLSTKVRFHPAHQYDQAGLMVRISPQCWIKTSVEYETDGPAKLGAVVTNHGYSDWSTQNFLSGSNELEFRIKRQGNDTIVEYFEPDGKGEWTQIRMAHLEGEHGAPVKCGLYACCPIEAGYSAEFDTLSVRRLL